MVCLALLLTCLVNIATLDEQRLQLGDDTRSNKDKTEDSEQSQLKVLETITNHPEGEAVQQGQQDVHEHFIVDVLSIAEQRDVHAVGDDLDLLPHGSCELMAIIDGTWWLSGGLRDDVVELFSHLLMLGRLKPNLVPVSVFRQTTGDNLDHVFGRVSLAWTRRSVAGKVRLDCACIVTNVAKINCLAALCEQKEGIELRKKLS